MTCYNDAGMRCISLQEAEQYSFSQELKKKTSLPDTVVKIFCVQMKF